MKTTLVLLITLIVYGCTSTEQQHATLADLNLYLRTDSKVDSVFISNIAMDREVKVIPYRDTLNIDFNDSINDLYNLTFYAGGKKIANQLWLKGENIIIKGILTNKLEIDTILGSDLYYKSIDFRMGYKELLDNESDSATINDFLLNELKANIDNLYSIEIANNFFLRNINRKDELKKLYRYQSNQNDKIKNHVINFYNKIENTLTVDMVDLAAFQFYNTSNDLIQLHIDVTRHFLIDFWFMGCPPCIQDHREMVNKQEFFHANNVELIGISTDKDQAKWREYVLEKNFYWRNVREVDDSQERLTTDMLITTFPTYLLLDSNGTIVFRSNSFSVMEEFLIQDNL